MGRLWGAGALVVGTAGAAGAGSWDCVIQEMCPHGGACEASPFAFSVSNTDGAYRMINDNGAEPVIAVELSETPGVLALIFEDRGRSLSMIVIQPDGRLTVADVTTRPTSRAGELFRATGDCTARP